jgi:CHAT domain-containing protein/tetratricopeptide (TPR) repeat protein
MHSAGWVFALAAAAVLGACNTLPPDAMLTKTGTVKAGELKPAGANTVGEACNYQATTNNLGTEFSGAYNLFCGTWQQPSGRVFQAAAPQPDSALLSQAQGGAWRSNLDRQFVCGEPARSTLLERAVQLSCTRRSGNYPQVAFIANVGGQTFYVDGISPALPALETTLAALSGQSVAINTKTNAAEQISAAVSGSSFGSGDLERYYTLMHLGNAANDADDFAAAEQAFREALAIQRKILGPNDPGLAMPEMHLALQISDQDRYVEADQMFTTASRLIDVHPDPILRARYEIYLAEHEINRQRYKEAAVHAARAEAGFTGDGRVPASLLNAASQGQAGAGGLRSGALAEAVFLTPDQQIAVSGLATTWAVEAELAYRAKDFNRARAYGSKITALLKVSGLNPPGIAPRSVRVAALAAASQGDLSGAASKLDDAYQLFAKYEANERPTAVTLFLAGKTAAEEGNQAEALELFRRGAKIAHDRRGELPEGIIRPYLVTLVAALQKDPQQSAALSAEFFSALQMIKGNVTGQVVSQALARLSSGDPKTRDLLRTIQDADLELRRLFLKLDALEQGGTGEAAAQESKTINDQIVATQAKRAAAESAAQTASPEYKQLTSAETSAAEVQHVLAPNEGLLQFSVGERSTFAALVTKDSITAYEIKLPEAEAETAVTALRKTIVKPDDSLVPPVFDVVGAHALYTTLFGPVDDRIRKLDRLTVIPSGPLTALPLEVLVTDPTPSVTDQDYKSVPFLITKVTIGYTPSPQNLVIQRQKQKPAQGDRAYIGFGDFQSWTPEQLAKTFSPEGCKADYDVLNGLEPLPGTRREILAVGTAVFHAPAEDMVLGAAFTKDRLTQDLTRYRIVHLATHASLPTQLHCRPEPLIILSTKRGAPNANDSFLGLKDIQSLKLDANLVLLSACNTAGPSGATTGDSLSGLAQAFFYAGARGLLVTHWDLEDSVAPLLTALTVAADDNATGLRKAKLAIIDKSLHLPDDKLSLLTHPYYWAPLVLVGDGVRAPAPAS